MNNLPAHIEPELFEKLPLRQQRLILHPEVLTNVVKAAIEVGYSASYAKSRAASLRRQLMYYIRPINEQRMRDSGITIERVREEYGAIAFSCETDYFDSVDTDEGPILFVKDVMLLPESMRRAIKSVNLSNVLDAEGNIKEQVVSVSLHDKQPALKALAEMLGGFDPRSRTPADTEAARKQAELFDFMEQIEIDTIVKIYRRAEARQRAQALPAQIIEGKAE